MMSEQRRFGLVGKNADLGSIVADGDGDRKRGGRIAREIAPSSFLKDLRLAKEDGGLESVIGYLESHLETVDDQAVALLFLENIQRQLERDIQDTSARLRALAIESFAYGSQSVLYAEFENGQARPREHKSFQAFLEQRTDDAIQRFGITDPQEIAEFRRYFVADADDDSYHYTSGDRGTWNHEAYVERFEDAKRAYLDIRAMQEESKKCQALVFHILEKQLEAKG